MQSLVFVVPGSITTRTGGSIYDRRMIDGLRRHGWAVDVRELEDTFPFPTSAALTGAAQALASVPDGTLVVVDGLALSVMPEVVEHERSRLRIVALVHLPVAAAVGLEPREAALLHARERRALAAAALVVVTGTATLPMLDSYGLSREGVVVVEPGCDRRPLARGSGGSTVQLLCAAAITRGKGHEVLLRALADVPLENWHLTCAGSVTRDPATVERIRAVMRQLKMEERITLAGDLDEGALAGRYERADLFVLATLQETYGMAVAEALAHGLPVVSTATGAIPALVGDEAGIVVPLGDVKALASALARTVGNAETRARFARGARCVRDRLPTWDAAAQRMSAALTPVIECPGSGGPEGPPLRRTTNGRRHG